MDEVAVENRVHDGARPILVVICDDDPDLLLLLRVHLARHPHIRIIAEARDGTEVVQLVRTSCPDVIVLNVAMPLMGGLEALPRIKENCPAAEVVFFTGYDRVIVPDIGSAFALVEKGQPLEGLVGLVIAAARQRVA